MTGVYGIATDEPNLSALSFQFVSRQQIGDCVPPFAVGWPLNGWQLIADDLGIPTGMTKRM